MYIDRIAHVNTSSDSNDFLAKGVLQRKCDCDRIRSVSTDCPECITRHSSSTPPESDRSSYMSEPSLINEVLQSPGQTLTPVTRGFMESRFGRNLSQVRVHTDSKAAKSAQSVNALAYTVGNNIAFDHGQYSPETINGKRLLAHELTHVLQQKSSQKPLQTKLALGGQTNAAERQADTTADAIVFGVGKVPNSFLAASPSIQRACTSATIGTPSGCVPDSPTFISGHPLFKFNRDCDDFATGEEANLISTVTGLPSTATIEVHGFASVDGDPTFNEHLSCARALKAKSVITSARPRGAGIAGGRISNVSRHGPTPGPALDRRSVVIRSSTPVTPVTPVTPLTVAFSHIQASTSPAGMSDRIPPRVDTTVGIGVVGFSIPMRPITLSIDGAGGGNGTATINGAATVDLTSSAAIRLRGVDQTTVGNSGNLRLAADQGGTRLATSNNFSVSAIPQDWSISFSSIVAGPLPGRAGTWRGFIVDDRWDSDSRPGSANVSDLDQTEISEEVESNPGTGVFAGVGVSASGFLPGNVFTTDTHASPVSLLTGSGNITLKQTSQFNDRRSGSTNIPLRNAGYHITHTATRIPLVGIVFVNHFKRGAATTANTFSSAAGAGSVSRTQRV